MNTAELKALVGGWSGYAQKNTLRFSSCPEPLPQGCLIEINGFGKSEFIAQILAEQQQSSVWIEESFTLNPLALFQRQVSLKNIFFVEAKENLFWASMQIVRSNLYNTVIINNPQWSLQQFRKLQLLAKSTKQFVFLLSKAPLNAWPISLRLQVHYRFFNQDFQIQVKRKRSF